MPRGRRLEALIPAGFVISVGACALSAAACSTPAARDALVTAAVGLFGAWADSYLAAVVTGMMGWCFATGFLVHAGGVLAFGRTDLLRMGAYIVVAVAGAACGHARRVHRARRRRRRLMRARKDAGRAPVLVGRMHGNARTIPR